MIDAATVAREAQSLVGIPYRHQGRTFAGVDCIGLIILVCRRLEIIDDALALPRNYHRLPARGLLEAQFEERCQKLDGPKAGAVVLMAWGHRQAASHCGILTDQNIVHAYQQVGRVVEHGFRTPWIERSRSFWGLPGVNYE